MTRPIGDRLDVCTEVMGSVRLHITQTDPIDLDFAQISQAISGALDLARSCIDILEARQQRLNVEELPDLATIAAGLQAERFGRR